MNNTLKQLRIQYLRETDRITAAMRNLRVDQFEFFAYDCLLNGDMEADEGAIPSSGVFLRAYENMNKHLTELEEASSGLRKFYEEIIKWIK